MKRILVSGANKGIGLALVEAILNHSDDTSVVLGSRSQTRGDEAKAGLVGKNPQWADRIVVVALDVSSDTSVNDAAKAVAALTPDNTTPLYAIVNNAGIGYGTGSLLDTLQVNAYGVRRVSEAFLPLLSSEGRIVNVTSAAGPMFVSACSAARQDFFLDPQVEWASLNALMEECIPLDGDDDAFAEKGLGSSNAYGFSKACANSYTLLLARENPSLMVSAVTPGYIETDLTRAYADANNRVVADMGMKQPAEGTKSAIFALFEPLKGSGFYYGSDAIRSPIDRYRGPGEPEYTGT
jgi:NAD(P)-dependent dehydrogenase (short-subunit alcohol dehydrogenase family)